MFLLEINDKVVTVSLEAAGVNWEDIRHAPTAFVLTQQVKVLGHKEEMGVFHLS